MSQSTPYNAVIAPSCIKLMTVRLIRRWGLKLNMMEVEVFKTDVADPEQAKWLTDQIEKSFTNYKVNFDLDDCDRILRVEYEGEIQPSLLIGMLKDVGYSAEVLPDIIQSISLTELIK